MKNEPIRHHYIPQFILKNFCFDGTKHLYFFDKKNKEIFIKDTRDIFMERNLYRDEVNNADPVKIEKDLSRFENEISHIIKEKFLNDSEIVLSVEEDEKLKLFFAIMGFRSKNTNDRFGENATKESRQFYSHYQKDGDLLDLWKRNLGYLVNCRSLKDVMEHENIDDPIKVFLMRDTFGVTGLYFVVAERREGCDFIIGDAYPVVVNGILPNGIPLPLFSIFPLSPKRVLMLVSNGANFAPREVVEFRECVLRNPKIDCNKITIRVKRLYQEEIEYINSLILKEAKKGIAFKNK